MGICQSTLKAEQRHLHQSQQGEPSEFYRACRDGNVERVKELLKDIAYEDLNCLEPDGSTPLHAASHYGHGDVVRLLLQECGCRRDHLNLHGLTAYEVASSQEIRQIFQRPGNRNQFCDQNDEDYRIEKMFKISTQEEIKEEEMSEEFTENPWIHGFGTPEEIKEITEDRAVAKTGVQSKLLMAVNNYCNIFSEATDTNVMEALNKLIDEHVTEQHRQFQKCKMLISEAFKEHKPEHLLRLYTLETPFYRTLIDNSQPLELPLVASYDELKPRFFQGVSYRGVTMTDDDLRAYHWALRNKGVVITRTFCSTSLNRSVAELFAEAWDSADGKRIVLMIFNFPEKSDTAINLGKLSNELPCVSEYENEAEVLVIPLTLFTVTQIKKADKYTEIYLEHIQVKQKSWLSALKWAIQHGRKKWRVRRNNGIPRQH